MRVYATTPEGERMLHHIECDRCDRRAKPGSEELLEGGWIKRGWSSGTPGTSSYDKNEVDLCPDHARDDTR